MLNVKKVLCAIEGQTGYTNHSLFLSESKPICINQNKCFWQRNQNRIMFPLLLTYLVYQIVLTLYRISIIPSLISCLCYHVVAVQFSALLWDRINKTNEKSVFLTYSSAVFAIHVKIYRWNATPAWERR